MTLFLSVFMTFMASCFLSLKAYTQVNCQETPRFEINLNKDSKGSLKDTPIQDQDGLGTCYANSTSILLEAWSGEPLSYHQIATNYGLSWKIPLLNNSAISREKFLSEFGWVCGAIKSIKENGNRVCKRSDSPIEYLLEEDGQKDFLLSLGHFYDSFHDKNKKEQEKIIGIIKKSIASSQESKFSICEDEVTLASAAEESLKKFATQLALDSYPTLSEMRIDFLNSKSSQEEGNARTNFCSNFYKELGETSIDESSPASEVTFKIADKKLAKLNKIIDEEFRSPSKMQMKKDQKKLMKKIITSFLETGGDSNEKFKISDCINLDTLFILTFGDPGKIDEVLSPIRAYSDPGFCLRYAQMNSINKAIESEKSCVEFDKGFEYFEHLLNSIKPNFQDEGKFTRNLLQLLEDPKKDINTFFKSLFENTCLENAITIPEDLECHWHLLPIRMNALQKAVTPAKEVEKFEREKTKKELNGIISSQLLSNFTDVDKKGKPVEISVCQNFLYDSSKKASWNPQTSSVYDCNLFPSSDTHSMVVSGMRCKDGLIQYQIQNSWGRDCSYLNPELQKECDPETGLFWASEDVIAENIFEVTVLSRKKNDKSFGIK